MSPITPIAVAYLRGRYALRRIVIEGLRRLLFRRPPAAVRRIAIHRVGAFGDSVVALPALSIIRHNYPEARIDLYSTQAVGLTIAALIDEGEVVDRIHLFPKGKGERAKALRRMRAEGYDLYVELPQNLTLYKSIRNMLVVRLHVGIRAAFGWDEGRIKALLAVQKRWLPPPQEVERFVNMLARQGLTGPIRFPLSLHPEDRAAVDRRLPAEGAERRVALLVGGKLPAKKWPVESWARLARRLEAEGYRVVVIGGPDERREGAAVAEGGEGALNLCGEFTVRQSAEALRRVALVIAQDTGAMHLAYAVGTPVVALFSTRELSDKWHPYGENNRVLERVLDCSFCFRKECADNRCMTDIGVEEVIAASRALIGDSSAPCPNPPSGGRLGTGGSHHEGREGERRS